MIIRYGDLLEKERELYNPHVFRAIAKYCDKYSDMNPFHLVGEIISNKRELWLIIDDNREFKAFATVQMVPLVDGNIVAEVLELAGDGGDILADSLIEFEEYLKGKNIYAIRPHGRLGWANRMKKNGYKLIYSIYEKVI